MLRQFTSSISKIDFILPRIRTHRTRTHRSLTPSSTRRHRSARRARQLLLALSRSRLYTSALTRRCYTMPFMATLAHSTLVTCIASPSSCTRFSATLRMKSAQWCSGAVQTRGVCKPKTCHGHASANMFQVVPTLLASSPATWF